MGLCQERVTLHCINSTKPQEEKRKEIYPVEFFRDVKTKEYKKLQIKDFCRIERRK